MSARKGVRDYPIFFLVSYALAVFPFLSLRYMPFLDLPEHLAAGAAIKDMLFGGPGALNYGFNGFFPYVLSWVLIAFLNVFWDTLTLAKLLVLIYFFVTPLSLYYFLDDKRKGLSLLSFPFLNNCALNMGFVNYIYSIPLFFFALGAYKKGSRAFYILALALFLTHPAVYGFFAFTIVVYYLSSRKEPKNILFTLSLFCFFFILLFTASAGSSQQHSKYPLPVYLVNGLFENVVNTLFNGFQFFRPDYPGILAFLIVSSLYAKQLFVDHRFDRKILFLSLALLVFIVFCPPTIPVGMGMWHTYNIRFFIYVPLLMLSDLRLGKDGQKALIVLFMFLTYANSLSFLGPYQEADRRLVSYYEPVVEKLPPGKKIYVVEETAMVPGYIFTSAHTYGTSPYTHYFSGYYSLKGGLSSDYFGAGMFPTSWPLAYTAQMPFLLCSNNVSYMCHLCEGVGVECEYPGENPSHAESGPYCVNCTRPMAFLCGPHPAEYVNNFFDTGSCIACEKKDIGCLLNHSLVRGNYDYLVAFSTSDDIEEYAVSGYDPFVLNQDVLVYAINRTGAT